MGRSKAAKERRQANKAEKEEVHRSSRAQLKREQRRNFIEIESRFRSAVGCGCPSWEVCSCGALGAELGQQPEVVETRLGGVEPEVVETRLGVVAARRTL